MDIKEIKNKKQKLEFDILHLITEFHKQTDLSVSEVRISSISDHGSSGGEYYQFTDRVTAEVRI